MKNALDGAENGIVKPVLWVCVHVFMYVKIPWKIIRMGEQRQSFGIAWAVKWTLLFLVNVKVPNNYAHLHHILNAMVYFFLFNKKCHLSFLFAVPLYFIRNNVYLLNTFLIMFSSKFDITNRQFCNILYCNLLVVIVFHRFAWGKFIRINIL